MGGSQSFLLKCGQEWVTFYEHWWEWVVFIEKWVGMDRFCRKMGESGWEWLGVTGRGWDRNSVKPVSVDYGKCIAMVS